MPTITVKLDTKRAARLARWAYTRKTTTSEVIRDLIDRPGRIETGDDLIEWAEKSEGKGRGFKQNLDAPGRPGRLVSHRTRTGECPS